MRQQRADRRAPSDRTSHEYKGHRSRILTVCVAENRAWRWVNGASTLNFDFDIDREIAGHEPSDGGRFCFFLCIGNVAVTGGHRPLISWCQLARAYRRAPGVRRKIRFAHDDAPRMSGGN